MANHEIKVKGVADFSSITQEAKQLRNTLQQEFGSGINVIDENSIDTLKREVEGALGRMNEQMSKLKDEAQGYSAELKNSNLTEKEQAKISKQRLDTLRKAAVLEREMAALKKKQGVLSKDVNLDQLRSMMNDQAQRDRRERLPVPVGPKLPTTQKEDIGAALRKQAMGQLGNVIDVVPGGRMLSTVAGSATGAASAAKSAGAGGMGTAAMATLGAVVGGLAVATMRMAEGAENFSSITPQMMKLGGMGVAPVARGSALEQYGQGMGYSAKDVLAAQESSARAFGGQKADVGAKWLMGTARTTGMEVGELGGMANQVRAVQGADQASRQMATMMEKAIASGMDKSQIANYAHASVGLLTSIDQSGITNPQELISALASMTAKGQMSPEMAAKTFQGLDQIIRGATGESQAFMQVSAMRAGLGGGTLAGLGMIQGRGLTGIDPKALESMTSGTQMGKEFAETLTSMGMTDKDYTKKVITSQLDELDNRFGKGGSKEQRVARMDAIGKLYNIQDPAKLVALVSAMERVRGGTANKKDLNLIKATVDENKAYSLKEQYEALKTTSSSLAAASADLESAANAFNSSAGLGQAIIGLTTTTRNLIADVDNALASAFTKGIDFIELMKKSDIGSALGGVGSAIKSILDVMVNDVKLVYNTTINDLMNMGTYLSDLFQTIGKFIMSPMKGWDAARQEVANERGAGQGSGQESRKKTSDAIYAEIAAKNRAQRGGLDDQIDAEMAKLNAAQSSNMDGPRNYDRGSNKLSAVGSMGILSNEDIGSTKASMMNAFAGKRGSTTGKPLTTEQRLEDLSQGMAIAFGEQISEQKLTNDLLKRLLDQSKQGKSAPKISKESST